MVSCFISRIVILIFGTLYPAYASYKAVRTKNVKEYVKWMMYWIVFAFFTSIETFTDLFLSFWFPFYYEMKIIMVIYLLSPATNGSSILYRKFVHPALVKREQEIDEYIAKAKEQGYHTMLNLGSKGVTYATSLIMQTAIKGGGGLVSQLKKSYSLGDLSEDQSISRGRDQRDAVDGRPYENQRIMKPSPDEPGLYFTEVDKMLRPLPPMLEEFYGRFPPSEEASSGYSSGDPVYYGDPLTRTASMGPSTRVRTRASTKAGLPKRGSLSEDGPTWLPGKINQSQREPDERFFIPLTHSSSLPVSFTTLNQLVKPEFQQVFGGLSQEQFFALINTTKPSSSNAGTVNETNISVIVSNDSGTDEKSQKETSSETKDVDEEGNMVEPAVEAETEKEVEKVEKYGKYNKRPAPLPPIKPEVPDKNEKDEEEFATPNSSPKFGRKISSSRTNLAEETVDESKKSSGDKTGNTLEVPKKSSKSKKPKKLHLPKMSFSFWNQKGGKNSSGSENSSIASSENLAVATTVSESADLEYFIPLKDDAQTENGPSNEKLLQRMRLYLKRRKREERR